jgi:ferritin
MENLLSPQEIEMINELGQMELEASQLYLHLANSMKSINFFGAASFFTNESNTEREHYAKLEDFMNNLGEQLEVRAISAVKAPINDLMEAFQAALEAEMDLLGEYEDAWEKSSPKTKALLHHFIELQTESVGEYGDLIARLSRTSEPILIDQELAK